MRLQADDLGPALGYQYFGPASFGVGTLVDYYTRPFLVVVAASLVVVVFQRASRRDAAFAALAALAVAAVLVTQLWRIHVPFDYRRAVYYLALPMVAIVGVAALRGKHRWLSLAAFAVGLAYIAHVSIGLRLPQRLLGSHEGRSVTVDAMRSFGQQLDREHVARRTLLVTDTCLGARVPYLVRRPTLIAEDEWQLGFERLLPPARLAKAVLAGGPAGRTLAVRLGVGYALVDPACSPHAVTDLGGRVVRRSGGLVIIALPRSPRSSARRSPASSRA
jgi:hypothetical protein